MSDPHPPISLLLERVNRLSRDLHDFREGQNQILRILARNVEHLGRDTAAVREELAGLRNEVRGLSKEVHELGAEQASLAMKVDEAIMRAAQVDRRLEDRNNGQPPAGSA